MKKLEQLGISPAPWTKAGDIVDDNEGLVIFNAYEDDDYANARLIAAAPDLYEALQMYQEAFSEIRKSAWFLDANFHEIMSLNKVMTAADAALAKAAGESEVRDER